MINGRRKKTLRAEALAIIAQEARHLADTAEYDELTKSDEEDDYLRDELRKWADILSLTSKTAQ